MPNMRDEYVRRHDEIWPEMIDELRAAGIRNYTIWNNGDELIGYYQEYGFHFVKKNPDKDLNQMIMLL